MTIFQKQKHDFKIIKTRSLKPRKIGIFAKGLVRGFGQKWEVWPCFYFSQNKRKKCVFCKISQKNVFENILETKKSFEDYKIEIFPKGQSMVLAKKLKCGHVFVFRKIRQKMWLTIFQKQKHDFKTIKTRGLKNRKIGIFAKGLVYGLGQKCEVWPCLYFSQNKPKKGV